MNLLIVISICILFSYYIKKIQKKINLNSSFKSYFDALTKVGKVTDNLIELKYSLNKLSKKGCILIFKIGLLSLPYLFIFLYLSLVQFNNQLQFLIPLLPYFILFSND